MAPRTTATKRMETIQTSAVNWASWQQAGDAVLADGVGHGAEGGDGREHMMKLTMPNIALRRRSSKSTSGCAVARNWREREAEEDAEQDDLQNVAGDEGVADAGGNDVEQERDDAEMLRAGGVAGDGGGVERGGIDVHATAGMENVDGDQAERAARWWRRPRSRSGPWRRRGRLR